MARLKVRMRGKVISELPLSEDRQYTGGRKDDADIRLQGEKGISREHFRLSAQNGVWSVESLSRFGEVLLGGEKVQSAQLEHGHMFSVPPYEFEFLLTSGDSAGASPSTSAAPMEDDGGAPPPMAMGAPIPTGAVAVAAHAEMSEEKTFVGVAPSVPYIKVMDSAGEAKELIRLEGGDSWIAGRDPSSQVQIKDSRVSRRQFEIRKNGGQYLILDLGSVNGTLVNGSPISSSEPTPLKSGDSITVLENYLYFELHDPNFRSRLELVNMQGMPEVNNALVPLGDVQPQYAPPPVPYDPAQAGYMPAVYDPAQAYPMVPGGQYPYPPMPYAPPGPAVPEQTGWKAKLDWEKNKKRYLLVGLILLIGIYMVSRPDPKPVASSNAKVDPLGKLTPEQRTLVKQTLQLAKSYYMQGKYEFAQGELSKMQALTPEFEDSRELEKLVKEAIHIQQLQRNQEKIERDRLEQEEKITKRTAECRGKMTPETTRDQMEACLADVIALQPDNPMIAAIFGEISAHEAARAAQKQKEAEYQAAVDKLKAIWARAKKLEKDIKYLDAIEVYGQVSASSLPDPGGLKSQAKLQIQSLRKQINSKTANYQTAAEKYFNEQKIKEAILLLRKARQVDPTNPTLQEKIDQFMLELRKNMLTLYQEGVLEESFGNIDGSENKGGAKEKWMKILELDVPDGEYYKKAYIKLKKYGAL